MPQDQKSSERPSPGRLSLFDAVNVSLGSIIGAGIFVILGAAAAVRPSSARS